MHSRLSALERQHLLPGTNPHAMADAHLVRAIAESVRLLLQSHAWPVGLAALLQRMDAGAMSEEDAQLSERLAAALMGTDRIAVDIVRQVFDIEARV